MTAPQTASSPTVQAGLFYAIAAYFIWGVVPLFWKQLDFVNSVELVVHRMVWSFVFVALYLLLKGEWRKLIPYLSDRPLMRRLVAASLLFSSNAAIFIWAVTNEHVLEASMGYFINPLFNVFFGLLIFGERLRFLQWVAIASALIGVAYLVFGFGSVPYVALSLAITFSSYGVIKKTISIPSAHGMMLETGIVLLPCLVYLGYLEYAGVGIFGNDVNTSVMLSMGGLITLMPLLLFATAAKMITMTALGITQYIGPTLQLIIGVYIFNEPFGTPQQVAFSFIWFGIVIYTLDQIRHGRQRRKIPMI